jgi:hypothetical protein
MNRPLHLLLLICFLTLLGLEKANAGDVVYKTLDFWKASVQGVNDYHSRWQAEEDGNTWALFQFNNYNGQWKCAACGSKERNTTPYIVNLQPFTKAITKIEITFNGVPSNILNSFVIYTGPDATISNHEFELNEHINKYVYKTSINNGIVTYTIAQPQKNSYYKLLWNLNKDKENGNIIIGKIVYYTSSVQSPDFSGGTAFLNNTTVTLSSIDEGAKIYYTTDGTEPTDKSTEYTAPFTLNTTTTVKAVAYLNDKKSDVASQTFKKVEDNDLTSVAQALKEADNTQVYVKAKVTKTDAYNSSSPTLNYYIADDENATNRLEVLNGRYLQDADITNANQIVHGDEVIVKATVGTTDKGAKVLQDVHLISINEYQEQAKVSSAGWATFVSRRSVDFSNTNGLTAYTVKYDATANQVTLSPVTAIPGNTAVVVKGDAGSYSLQQGDPGTTITDNDLKFSDADTKVTASYSIYVLARHGDGCGFYPVKAGETLAPYKGYLTIPAASSAKPFYAIGNSTTGITNAVKATKNTDGVHYNLAGQRVNDNYQGLVIVNGHKVIMK